MAGKVKFFLLLMTFGFLSLAGYCQNKIMPPPPQMKQASTPPPDCGDRKGTYDKDGNYIPPPPGLCLPIDDYIFYLLAAGILYGAYRAHQLQKA